MKIQSAAIAFLLCSAPSLFALNNRSAVSLNGLDTNPCTPASPCRSFSTALTQTNPGGEVIALDSAGYGPFNVTFEVSVSGAPGAHAALTVTTADGILVTAGATDRVVIKNLILIGAGGLYGIQDTFSKEVAVIGCLIRGFSSSGVQIESTANNASIDESTIIENAAAGINQAGGGGAHRVVISRSLVHLNNIGIHAQQSGEFVVEDTIVSSNNTAGVEVDASTGNTFLTAKRCAIVSNIGPGVYTLVTGQNVATVHLAENVIAFNSTYGVLNNSVVYTFHDNRIAYNSSGDVGGLALTLKSLQ